MGVPAETPPAGKVKMTTRQHQHYRTTGRDHYNAISEVALQNNWTRATSASKGLSAEQRGFFADGRLVRFIRAGQIVDVYWNRAGYLCMGRTLDSVLAVLRAPRPEVEEAQREALQEMAARLCDEDLLGAYARAEVEADEVASAVLGAAVLERMARR